MLKYSKISTFRLKKILKCFVVAIPASKTALLLGMNRNTINRYYQICRGVIYLHQMNETTKMFGVVEVDESYFGAKRIRGHKVKLKRGRGTLKQPVFGVFEREGRVYTEIVPDCSKSTLQTIIRGHVGIETIFMSDSWRGYSGLVDVGYDKHFRVNHGKSEFSKGQGIHISGIESFWSFTKRRLNKFNGVSVNFEFHLKECEWRWNRKEEQLLTDLLKLIRIYGDEVVEMIYHSDSNSFKP
jgi:transposase-like protein